MPNCRAISRRAFALGSLALPLANRSSFVYGHFATPAPIEQDRPESVYLDSGIVISDFRVFPADDSRFLIEIENHGDTAIDTPIIGATILGTSDPDSSFTWAIPWHIVLEPGGSTFGTGLLPKDLTSIDQMAWTLCYSTVATGPYTNERSQWDFELEYAVEIVSEAALRIHLKLTNSGTDRMRLVELRSLFRDQNGRICGASPTLPPVHIPAGESIERTIGFSAGWESPFNPFQFVQHAEDLNLIIDIQPRGPAVQPGCPAVMPWNRDD